MRNDAHGTSLVVQWLRLHAPNAGSLGSIPGWGTRSRMPPATKSSHAATKSLHAATKRSSMPQQRSHVPHLRPGAARINK